MSAFRGNSRRSSLREQTLIQLVEEYLLSNSHRYFVNLDDMGEVIRRKSFTFARMKLPVFKVKLKEAYKQYSERKERTNDEFSGKDIVLDNTPLTDETLRQMEDDPSEDSEDANWKIDESSMDASKDTGANQMKNLYMPASGVSTENKDGRNGNAVSSKGESSNRLNIDESQNHGSPDCISVSSSISSKSNRKSVPVSDPTPPMDVENASESDCEIIEEVTHFGDPINGQTTVIVQATQNGSNETVQRQAAFESRKSLTEKVPIFAQTVGQSPGAKPRSSQGRGGPASVEPNLEAKSNKGVKRKPKNFVENSVGINEEYARKRPRKEVNVVHDTGYKLQDFAGSEKVVEEVCKLLMHLKHPEIYQTLGVTPPRGFLLHGPPGTGKTLLANAIAGELETPMLKVAGTELVSGISGESESNIRELFNQAVAAAPCIVFIDEIDSVTPKRENVNKEMERRIVAQLLACIDDLGNREKGDQVLLVGATNRVEAIDTALRRAGRFDREICLGIPDEKSRGKILSVICRDLRLETGFDIKALARLTPGYVGADLQALVREAAVQAVNRKIISEDSGEIETTAPSTKKDENIEDMEIVPNPEANPHECASEAAKVNENAESTNVNEDTEAVKLNEDPSFGNDTEKKSSQSSDHLKPNPEHAKSSPLNWIKQTSPLTSEELKDLFVTMKDFEFALKNVQPSSKREGFATVPDTTWDDIGALHEIRDELQVSILGPVKHAEAFKKLGLTTPAGVLLCGPPGCGKTLLAKAVANEAGINFISVKGPELLNMYVGESERAIRQCFLRARNSSPCVIFFDELDALCPRRSDVADSGSGGRIVNQLLTEMDGMESRQGVFVMAATNRPDIIDPAIMRPGRLDKILFVSLPTSKDRFEILKALTKNLTKPVLDEDVNLEEIASCPECENYTGADLSALVREASIAAFRELVLHNTTGTSNDLKVYRRHFTTAFTKTKPSVNQEDRLKYTKMAEKYSSSH